MKLLKDFDENTVFYRGTIIVLKDKHISPKGNFDKKYCMIGNLGADFKMLDLYRSIGSCIIHDLKPNVNDHFGCNKEGIYNWIKQYFEYFYTKEGQEENIPKIYEFTYIKE